MESETKHLRIFGVVQGVSYRAWAARKATDMGLSGWVRNRTLNNSVEITVTGDQDTVQKFISACYEGPQTAQVDVIEVNDGINEELDSFEIRATV